MRGWPLRRVLVAGRSMEPELRAGDQLLVWWGAPARVGKLVVVALPDRPLGVKRAVRRTPDGWWVEGTHPDSTDSRVFGAVPERAVLGRVLLRYWRSRS